MGTIRMSGWGSPTQQTLLTLVTIMRHMEGCYSTSTSYHDMRL
jgi:hypothetical protein